MISKGEIVHRPREGNQHSQSGFLVTSTFLTFFPVKTAFIPSVLCSYVLKVAYLKLDEMREIC